MDMAKPLELARLGDDNQLTITRSAFESLVQELRSVMAQADVLATLGATGDVTGLKQHTLTTALLDIERRLDGIHDRLHAECTAPHQEPAEGGRQI